jgi:hypothetical protein
VVGEDEDLLELHAPARSTIAAPNDITATMGNRGTGLIAFRSSPLEVRLSHVVGKPYSKSCARCQRCPRGKGHCGAEKH